MINLFNFPLVKKKYVFHLYNVSLKQLSDDVQTNRDIFAHNQHVIDNQGLVLKWLMWLVVVGNILWMVLRTH